MEEFLGFVRRDGFAIAVAAYLLIRLDITLRQLRDNLRDLVKELRGHWQE